MTSRRPRRQEVLHRRRGQRHAAAGARHRRDITDLADELRDRHERLRALAARRGEPGRRTRRSSTQVAGRARARPGTDARTASTNWRELGVELKDYFTGLVDFPLLDGRPRGLPVLEAGRAGGRPLARAGRRLRGPAEAARSSRPPTADSREPCSDRRRMSRMTPLVGYLLLFVGGRRRLHLRPPAGRQADPARQAGRRRR